jgi:hypothetical protein
VSPLQILHASHSQADPTPSRLLRECGAERRLGRQARTGPRAANHVQRRLALCIPRLTELSIRTSWRSVSHQCPAVNTDPGRRKQFSQQADGHFQPARSSIYSVITSSLAPPAVVTRNAKGEKAASKVDRTQPLDPNKCGTNRCYLPPTIWRLGAYQPAELMVPLFLRLLLETVKSPFFLSSQPPHLFSWPSQSCQRFRRSACGQGDPPGQFGLAPSPYYQLRFSCCAPSVPSGLNPWRRSPRLPRLHHLVPRPGCGERQAHPEDDGVSGVRLRHTFWKEY